MAANKFATVLRRNTSKITVVLVNAILEWVLIILLLLNSLFSYLIIKFSDYFGLKRPCLWCSRLDHIFEPAKFQNPYRSLVCEAHGIEISKLGYCSSHGRLAESKDMCEDCLSLPRNELSKKFAFFPWMKQLGVGQDLVGDKVSENGEVVLKCSCCGASLDTKSDFPDHYMSVVKPCWGDLDYSQKGNLTLEPETNGQVGEGVVLVRNKSNFMSDLCEEVKGICDNREEKTEENSSCCVCNFDCKEKAANEDEREDVFIQQQEEPVKSEDLNVSLNDPSHNLAVTFQVTCEGVVCSKIQPRHLEFYIDQDDCHLIPIEFTGCSATEQIQKKVEIGTEEKHGDEDFVVEFEKDARPHYELVVEETCCFEENVPLLIADESDELPKPEILQLREVVENDNSSGLNADCDFVREHVEQIDIAEGFHTDFDLVKEEVEHVGVAEGLHEDCDLGKDDFEQIDIVEAMRVPTCDGNGVQESPMTGADKKEAETNQDYDEELHMQVDEVEADVSIGTEIPDHEPIDEIQLEVVPPPYLSTERDSTTSNGFYRVHDDDEPKQAEDDVIEFRTLSMETNEQVINNHLSLFSESNEIEEDKLPDTPMSIDSLHYLHKKLLLLDRREAGTEDSLDGSFISDIEVIDGELTVEKLKKALKSETKAFNALYAELEEERSASAVAANHTMAMINRLQEEKAAVQMEALQYQRMMEEQSAYDQEALQLLNELMVKREKEKAELEKELEWYQKRAENYEAKEKMLMLKRSKDGSTRSESSSVSCSNAEVNDGLSVDLNHEEKEDSFINHQDNGNWHTPPDAVLYLEESLANFEEERLSILGELKVLEEKLFTISDGKEQYFEDIKPIEHLYEENGNGYQENSYHSSPANDGVANGHYKEMNGANHLERKNFGTKAKRLLPLFDAAEAETKDHMVNGHTDRVDSFALPKLAYKFDMDSRKPSIAEEVDHVYERLQALEADREFLKHCITSLRKGDKGIELLQEILHHLRALRIVEYRARNIGDSNL